MLTIHFPAHIVWGAFALSHPAALQRDLILSRCLCHVADVTERAQYGHGPRLPAGERSFNQTTTTAPDNVSRLRRTPSRGTNSLTGGVGIPYSAATMGRHSICHCFPLAMLIIPPLLLVLYFLAVFPAPPTPMTVHQSLASLPSDSRSWSIYPEDFYPGGAYADLPYGKVCIRLWTSLGYVLTKFL